MYERLNITEMKFSYNKLWKLLIDEKTLKNICKALDCNVGDIVDFVRE